VSSSILLAAIFVATLEIVMGAAAADFSVCARLSQDTYRI
jgi:hypothetical protein